MPELLVADNGSKASVFKILAEDENGASTSINPEQQLFPQSGNSKVDAPILECVTLLRKSLSTGRALKIAIVECDERISHDTTGAGHGVGGYYTVDSLCDAVQELRLGKQMPSSSQGTPMRSRKERGVRRLLSPRELEVIELLSLGFVYKEISDKLGIDSETVRFHVRNVCKKMRVRSRIEAVVKFCR